MKSLSHNGVLVNEYEPKGFGIKYKGNSIKLNPEQEEMAVAWVKKLGTDYVNDTVFAKNFFKDFRKSLGIKENANREDFDFSEIESFVYAEREKKLAMSKEEKKKLAADRKLIREANKETYGYVNIDGERTEISNYLVEPSSIFMGRGKHPLRGRWKQGAKESDIVLNMSPDSNVPEGKWKAVVWNPDYMWVARWTDKLTGKKKYVWLSESSSIRQRKEIEKFDKASKLDNVYPEIREYIKDNLSSSDIRRRKVATVAFLIDTLNIRVGDEKDEDEADTVGASTLTKKNIIIKPNNVVEFDFIGKDSVRLKTEVKLPDNAVENLREFLSLAKTDDSRVFDGIRSETISTFLDEVAPGMSAKVFRTYHATNAVSDYLKKNTVDDSHTDDYKKHVAKMANLQAAILCNHKRAIPKSWQSSLDKKKERLKSRKLKSKRAIKKLNEKAKTMEEKYNDTLKRYDEKLKKYNTDLKELQKNGRKTTSKKKTIETQRRRIKKLKAKYAERVKKLNKQIKNRKEKDRSYAEKMKLNIKEQQATKDYNLGTSLKSYIDPRIYKEWFSRVGFDWKKYYSKTLQRKFSWVEKE